MIRILHTADWHLGRRLEGRSRHLEQVEVLDEIVRIAAEENVDLVIVAGDVFDTAVPTAEAEALYFRTMARLADGARRAVVVIAGNHDAPDRLIASDPFARELGITTIGYPRDVPALYDGGDERAACTAAAASLVTLRLPRSRRPVSILALPYPSESRLREVITESLENQEQAVIDYDRRVREFMASSCGARAAGGDLIVASHVYVRGGVGCDSERQIEVGGAYAVDTASFPEQASYVALGHLHRPQEYRGCAGQPVRYSGSILQYSFSEAGQQKSVTIVEIDETGCRHREVPLTAGRSLYSWTDLSGFDEIERRLATADPLGWYRITVRVAEPIAPELLAALRERFPGIIDCLPIYETTQSGEESVRISELSLEEQFRRFVETRHGEPCPDDVMQLLLETMNKV